MSLQALFGQSLAENLEDIMLYQRVADKNYMDRQKEDQRNNSGGKEKKSEESVKRNRSDVDSDSEDDMRKNVNDRPFRRWREAAPLRSVFNGFPDHILNFQQKLSTVKNAEYERNNSDVNSTNTMNRRSTKSVGRKRIRKMQIDSNHNENSLIENTSVDVSNRSSSYANNDVKEELLEPNRKRRKR